MKSAWNASYYERESGTKEDVRISVDAAGVHIERAGQSYVWGYAEIVQKSGAYPGEPVRLDRGDQLVVVPDRAFAYELQRFAPQLGRAARDPDAKSALLTVVLIWAGIFTAMGVGAWLAWPWMEDAAAAAVPAHVEESLGKATVAQITAASPVCPGSELNDAVEGIVKRLASGIENNPYTFRVTIVDEPVVNALAAPGGYIAVYRGLIQRTESLDELAGVLAHEMQHVVQRHSVKGMLRGLGIAAVISMVFGDTSSIAGAAGKLTDLSFQRQDEEEADREGMAALRRARLNADAMVSVYEKLARESADLPGAVRYLSTHPQMEDRVKNLRIMAREARYIAVRMEGSERWSRIKLNCR